MKKLLTITVILFSSTTYSQFVYKIKADSVKITNDSCDAELIIENSTKDTLGFLYNKGNGRTEFRKVLIKLNDTTYIVGEDTLLLSGGVNGSGNNNYIQNQFGASQSGRFWVGGQIRTDSMLRMGTLSTAPTGANGMIYYNSTGHRFRGYQNSAWVDFVTTGSISGYNGVQFYYDAIHTNKWLFQLGEPWFPAGPPTPGASKLTAHTVIPMNGNYLTFLKGDNTTGNSSNYTHITSNRGITLGSVQDIPTGSLLRIGSFAPTGAKATWYNPETSNTTPNELAHIYYNPTVINGTNGTEARGLLIEVDMGATVGNNYTTKKPIGSDIYVRANSNYNASYSGDWVGLRLKSVSWNTTYVPKSKMYALWVDSGRSYFGDSVMIGTSTPRAKFTHDGTASFNLGGDATGDLFYRNSSGLFTPLPIGTSGQQLVVQSGLPTWSTVKLKTTTTLDFSNTNSLSSSTLNVTVTGAAVGDHVLVTKADGTSANGELYTATVSSSDTVTVRFQNVSGSAIDLASASYNITVIKF